MGTNQDIIVMEMCGCLDVWMSGCVDVRMFDESLGWFGGCGVPLNNKIWGAVVGAQSARVLEG